MGTGAELMGTVNAKPLFPGRDYHHRQYSPSVLKTMLMVSRIISYTGCAGHTNGK